MPYSEQVSSVWRRNLKWVREWVMRPVNQERAPRTPTEQFRVADELTTLDAANALRAVSKRRWQKNPDVVAALNEAAAAASRAGTLMLRSPVYRPGGKNR